MRTIKRRISLAVTLTMLTQLFSFAPKAEETVTPVALGEAVYVYNVSGGDAAALTDGDESTLLSFDRRKNDGTWIAAVVYDAGEGEAFDFNQVILKGEGVHFFGAYAAENGDKNLLDIAGTIDTSVNYSENIDRFADEYGLFDICYMANGNYYVDETYDSDELLSYRYFVAVMYNGWTSADINEIYVNLVEKEELPDRIVTFGENITVTVDVAEISSGDAVKEGTVVEISPVLEEHTILDTIFVNGEAIQGTSYTVGGEDIEITFTCTEIDPDSVPLGSPVYVYNIPKGSPEYMTDGRLDTSLSFSRSKDALDRDTYISVAVYDAGEGKTFDFSRIELVSGSIARFYGTNEAVNGDFNLLDIENTIEKPHDYSSAGDEYFAECYGLTSLGSFNNTFKTFGEQQSYRYFVVALTDGWQYNTVVTEITLSNKVYSAEVGQVVFAGGNEAVKSGQGSSSTKTVEFSVSDADLGITSGETEDVTVWGWVGGSDSSAVSSGGTVTYLLQSDRDLYADVKILGAEVADDRDYTVWVEGENGEASSAFVLARDGVSAGGGTAIYTVKNLKVFAGLNSVKIGSSQHSYAPDFAAAVFADKTASLAGVGEIVYAEGEETDMGKLANADKLIREFFPDKIGGDAIGALEISSEASAQVLCENEGKYNLLVLSGEGTAYADINGREYSAKNNSAAYSTVGGLYVTLIKNVELSQGINEITVSANELAAFKVTALRNNTVTFGEEITVTGDGKIINSGDAVADGTVLTISAFSTEGYIVDKILVNGVEIQGGKYTVFNEDIEITAEFIEAMYVPVTFDEGITVLVDGSAVSSGDMVRGDAYLRFSVRGSSGMKVVYSVNGTEIEGNSYTLNKEGINVTVTLTPYDLIYIEDYEVSLYDETETAVRYLLPKYGEYGGEYVWSLSDTSKGDTIESFDENDYILSANMADNGFEPRTIELKARITVNGTLYTVVKTVYASSDAIQDIGGRSFYIRAIGAGKASFALDNGQFAISGTGSDLWTAPDSFGYLYTRSDDENFTVSAKVDKIEGTNQWRRTGIMLRESAADGARFVMLDLGADNGSGLEFAARNANDGRAYEIYRDKAAVKGKSSFGYIKLEKIGNTFNAYYSEDGEAYNLLASTELEFEADYLAGLFSESESGAAYFSRFELNGVDVLSSGAATNAAYEPADGKIRVTWTDPAEYSTFSYEAVIVTADCGDGKPAAVEVPKGTETAVIEGLVNESEYEVTIRTKTAELCGEAVNNASAYNALGAAARLKARPFNAAEYAAKTPSVTISGSETVMAGERNGISLSFNEEQPVCGFKMEILLPEGVGADSMSFAEGCEASAAEGKITVVYSGSAPVKEIGRLVLTADAVGEYEISVYAEASYYSFEDGILTAPKAELGKFAALVTDVRYVTVTFDEGITAEIDGEKISSGATARGDAVIELSCDAPANSELTFSVNGEAIEGSKITLNKEDVYITYEIVPYDVKYIREYELVQRTETEAGALFDLPERGEYGSAVTWTVNDNLYGDYITEVDYGSALLTVDMAAGNYVNRAVSLTASVEFGGRTYKIDKTVYASTDIVRDLGGVRFYLRQIGRDDQSTAALATDNNQYYLTGQGGDLWNTPDSFGYLYTKSSDSDFAISVKVDKTEGSNQWRRSGIMLRQSDSENEKMVMLSVGAGNGAALEYAYRVGTTGSASQILRSYSYPGSLWLKIEKKGNKFYAYCSTDGEQYTLLSETPAIVTFTGDYLAGIFSESETGGTYFSRLELNGNDIYVSSDISAAAVTPSEGKIRVTWTDPSEKNGRTFEDILVTVTGRGRTTETVVAKGVQEAVIDNLTNGTMYTVTVQARTAPLCTGSDNGASSYRAASAPVTMTAFPVDVEYLAAINPVVELTAAGSVVVGQSNELKLAFEDMQPVYKLALSVEIPDHITVKEKDIALDEAFEKAGGKAEIDGGVLRLTYEAQGAEDIIYLTDIAAVTLSSDYAKTYNLAAEGTVTYYSYEIGELPAEISNESNVSFKVLAEKKVSSFGGSGGSGGSGGAAISSGTSVSTVPTVAKTPDGSDAFADKASIPSWALTSVNRLTEREIISGIETEEGLMFLPDGEITREQFVKLCVTAFMTADSGTDCDFTDVETGAWYYPYVATMVEKGIINGMGDGRFGVGESISRQDMAVIIYKLYVNGYIKNLSSGAVVRFADGDAIAPYALEAVTVLRAAGVINGYTDNTFAPKAKVSRAMAAKVIFGCLN